MRRLVSLEIKNPVVVEGVDWPRYASGLVKAALKRRQMTYADLIEALDRMGIKESDQNLRNKLSRGTFTAAFLLQCLAAMGTSYLDISDVFEPEHMVGKVKRGARLDEREE